MLINFSDVDHVVANPNYSQCEAQLKNFDDNESVVIKCRSPTMRHVSQIHRVALDRLFVRINLDPKIQIKNHDNKNRILTKKNFTRDERNHFLSPFV